VRLEPPHRAGTGTIATQEEAAIAPELRPGCPGRSTLHTSRLEDQPPLAGPRFIKSQAYASL